MNKINFFKIILIFLFLSSCASVRSGFAPKKENSDEFLVEKKMPLKMPPAFNELPTPGQKNEIKNNEIKSLISKNENGTTAQSNSKEMSKNTKESLLEKIKKN